MRAIGALADRMLTAVVPKTTAGACPCNDSYQAFCFCLKAYHKAFYKTCHTNCDCSRTTCGDCFITNTYCS
jgi:hypothetical protein